MTYVAGKDYPSNFESKYKNLVASGLRPSTRIYFQYPGHKSSDPWYELFYDVYLIDYNEPLNGKNPFVYEYVYWLTQVKLGTKGTTSTPVGTQKWLQQSWKNVFSIEGQVLDKIVLGGHTRVPSAFSNYWYRKDTRFDQSLPHHTSQRVPIPMGDPLTTSIPTTPASFQWKSVSIPKRGWVSIPHAGPGGQPYYTSSGSPAPGVGGGEPPGSGGNSGGSGADTGSGDSSGGSDSSEAEDANTDVGYSPPKKRTLRTNPPLISTATGAYVGVNVDGVFDPTEPGTRNSILGSGTAWQRRMRKGIIRQYIVNENEWKISGGSTTSVVTKYDKKGKPKKTDTWDADASVLDPKIEYGFRFHYNPAEIGFSTMPVDGLDPALLLSGLDKAFPVAAEGASVSFNLYLNRIEDMSLLKKAGDNSIKTWRPLYAGKALTQEDLQGILKRGTGYDLEYLFRTALGRPWVTQLRGATADLGVVVGLPMLINLGGGMKYTGRLTGLQYTHNSFTQDMVPMFTTVSITFTRMPDSVQFSQSGNG